MNITLYYYYIQWNIFVILLAILKASFQVLGFNKILFNNFLFKLNKYFFFFFNKV